MTEKPEPTEAELERGILRALGGLNRAVEKYIQARRSSRLIEMTPGLGIADKAAPERR